MTKRLARLLATGFYSGYSPFAPGTVGTLVAAPFAYALHLTGSAINALLMLTVIIGGSPLCGIAAKDFGKKDPGHIVLDEFAGYFVATFMLKPTVLSYLAAFFLFRLFDIIKPPPANMLDRWDGGGWSIMLDDVAAGVMARLSLALLGFAATQW